MHAACCIALVTSLTAGAAYAQVYKWVDADGVTHYGERPPAGAAPKPSDPPARAKQLDIALTGNDPPQAVGPRCDLNCQYERMRADRLQREESWRRDEEVRLKAVTEARHREENQRAASRDPRDAAWFPGGPIFRPGIVVGRPIGARPNPNPPAPRGEPGVSILGPGER